MSTDSLSLLGMRKLALLILAVGAAAVLSVPSAYAQAKCGNDICIGSPGTQVHVKGNLILDRPILPGTSTPIIVDGGLTVVGTEAASGTQALVKADVIDAGTGNVVGTWAMGTAKANIVDAGVFFLQGTGPLYRIIPFTTAAIDFANATIVCEDSSGTTVTGARTTDTCTVGMPTSLTGAGTGLHHTFSCYVSATDTVKIRACAAGTADNPGSVTFTGYVLSAQQ